VEFRQWVAKGYRLTSVSGYQVAGVVRYAAIWEQTAGPPWRARHGLTAAQYRSTIDAMSAEGYRPILLDAYATDGGARFAAIFQQDSTPTVARHGLTAVQLEAESDRWAGQGYRLRDVSGYESGGAARYAAIWERRTGSAQRAVHELNATEYQATLDAFIGRGYWPVDVSVFRVGRDTRYAAIFEAGDEQPWLERHGLDAAAYRQSIADLRLQGYRPVMVNAHTGASGTRFALIWRNPAFKAGDLRRVDAIVEQAMSRSNTVGLSLAITHRGRLMFAKAYGRVGPGSRDPLHTANRLRIASVSKPLTAIEIMRLAEGGRLRLDQRVFGEGALLGERYGPASRYADPRVKDITVQQLLEHTEGGWDNDAQDGAPDPTFLQPHLNRDELLSWVLRNVKLEYQPGTIHQYSNFGYAVLGRIIEHVTGKPYAEAMREDVFQPAGASSFALARQARAERLPGEAAYAQLGANGDEPYELPIERMDAHGGWVATPVDLLRVLARADGFPSVPDRLDSTTLATMTTPTNRPTPGGKPASYAKGWAVNNVPNWWHAGYLPGTSSLLVRTADRYGPTGREEFTWAAVTNSTNAQHALDLDLDALMWQVVDSVQTWPNHDLF
jgi:CubicO group peptidase (beta-lactamase class C family)